MGSSGSKRRGPFDGYQYSRNGPSSPWSSTPSFGQLSLSISQGGNKSNPSGSNGPSGSGFGGGVSGFGGGGSGFSGGGSGFGGGGSGFGGGVSGGIGSGGY